MTYLAKPKFHHPDLPKNALGFTHRDYEGSISTLCAGCGHDSISSAIMRACFELSLPPHRIAKLSGIGCSSKTPTYFLREAHGFNGVHGRMPALVTGANAANRDTIYIGVSGDGDSLSIGLGQMCHAIRRNVNMLYVLVKEDARFRRAGVQNHALTVALLSVSPFLSFVAFVGAVAAALVCERHARTLGEAGLQQFSDAMRGRFGPGQRPGA